MNKQTSPTSVTTFEDHDTYCPRCSADLGPCPPDEGCINRYAHAVDVCKACQAEGQEE